MLSNIRFKSCVITDWSRCSPPNPPQTSAGVLLQTQTPPRPVLTSWPCRRKRSVFPGRSPPRLGCSSPPASAELCAHAGSSGRACSRWRWPYSTVWQTHKHTFSQLTLTTAHAPHPPTRAFSNISFSPLPPAQRGSRKRRRVRWPVLPSRHCQSSPGVSTCTHKHTH